MESRSRIGLGKDDRPELAGNRTPFRKLHRIGVGIVVGILNRVPFVNAPKLACGLVVQPEFRAKSSHTQKSEQGQIR